MGDLDAFVAARGGRDRCKACVAARSRPDLWSEVVAHRGRRPPTSFDVIADYLATKDVYLSGETIRGHFRGGHEQ